MFAAVSAHKFVIAFCVGVELMVQRTQLWLAFVYVIIYSIVSAIGLYMHCISLVHNNQSTPIRNRRRHHSHFGLKR
jgi:disulfide bond formation protein DsbB